MRLSTPEFGSFSSSTPPNREKPKSVSEQKEFQEHIDNMLLELVDTYAEKINEGNNGVIFRLKVEEIPPHIRMELENAGADFSSATAIKILKIYTKGSALTEFTLQQRAEKILEPVKNDPTFAKVPRATFYREINVYGTLSQKLKEAGIGFTDRVELFIMDLIPGDDLATALYREAITRYVKMNPDAQYRVRNEPSRMSFQELHQAVSVLFDFRRPGGKGSTPGEREYEARKIEIENSEKLMSFLAKSGYQLHPSIIERIKNSMDRFHENGLCFRDGHHRNFLVVGDASASAATPPDTYIIDFGSAKTFTGTYQEASKDLYSESFGDDKREFPTDEFIVQHLTPLTRPLVERQNAPILAFVKSIQQRAGLLETRNPAWKQLKERILSKWTAGTLNLGQDIAWDPQAKNPESVAALVVALASTHPESRTMLRRFVLDQEKKGWLKRDVDRLVQWLNNSGE